LGEVGDYLLENDQVRVIIQNKGFSRGFGVYGGSLIDADLVRPTAEGGSNGGLGQDRFGELFPIFFLEALVPEEVTVLSDGTDGSVAKVRVGGNGGEFLTLTKALNQAVLNSHEIKNITELLNPDALNGAPQLQFQTVYSLAPGARHVTIETTLTNTTDKDLPIPSDVANGLLGTLLGIQGGIDVPLGHVLLFGAGNEVFAPGFGYDIRFSLDESYAGGAGLPFPALPGLLTDGLITSNEGGVSYGFFAKGDTPNFAQERKKCPGEQEECDPSARVNAYEDVYGDVKATENSLLVPFLASAFTGVFYGQSPRALAPGASFTFTSYFVIGDGDVSSVMDEWYQIQGAEVGDVTGLVRDQATQGPVEGASVIVYDAQGKPANQFYTDARGQFRGKLPPGRWTATVTSDPMSSEPVAFEVQAGKGAFAELSLPSPARVQVQIRDEAGQPIPGKVTVVGTINPADAGKEPRKFLFDLKVGESFRATDFVPDDPEDPRTLQYIEATGYTHDGSLILEVRPDRPYTVYVSRGVEFDLQEATVRPAAGTTAPVSAVLKRVVQTPGYVSGDFHLHADPSIDSSLSLERRIISSAGEGLELAVATDHNFVTDYRPTIERLNLQEHINSMVGLEMTTLESGHFNGFPIKRDVGKITRGAFEWSLRTPDEIFGDLRAMGKYGPENVVIQVNHARDAILGYFTQYEFDPLNAEIPTPTPGGFDLGALASPNGPAFKRYFNAEGEPCDPKAEPVDPMCKLKSVFSSNFDAMEIFNGKRLDQNRHFRVPSDLSKYTIPEETLGKLPAAGELLCDGEELAFPGVIDDWFNLLNQGKMVAGLGNSDSHGDHLEEPAYPRTYVYLGQDDPSQIDDLAVVRAIQNHRAIVTNGPFVELFINGQPVGAKLEDTDGEVDLRVKIQAPAWIGVDTLNLIVNGETVEAVPVSMSGGVFEYEAKRALPRDSWFVVEVTGRESMFPVVAPLEIPPVALSDAVGALSGPLGFGSTELGDLMPSMTRVVTAYAITNPIWVDSDGAGFEAPGLPRRACDGFGVALEGAESKPLGLAVDGKGAGELAKLPGAKLRSQMKREGWRPSVWFPRQRGDVHDIRVIFDHFSGHAHVH
jgi:hypothetical protein